MNKAIPLIVICAALSAAGCGEEVSSSLDDSGDWLVPVSQVFDGGPGKDGIPALRNPAHIDLGEAGYMNDNDLVVGVAAGGELRAYPHSILDWHEIINDAIGDVAFAVTYCPLTGSGITWDVTLGAGPTSFGVSGLLYNSNLIPYDRATDSNWSQMRLECVNGALIGRPADLLTTVETTWKTWRESYPASSVVSRSTGFGRPYGNYPYGDYRSNHNRLIFPVSPTDGRLERKTRVLGVAYAEAGKAYRIGAFPTGTEVFEDEVDGVAIVVAGSRGANFAVAFERKLTDGTTLDFSAAASGLPALFLDGEGNTWDLMGRAIAGPRTGQRLTQARGYIASWFAWAAFHPGSAIHDGG